MKGIGWIWLAALLMGLSIVGLMDVASAPEPEPVIVTASTEMGS